jgi:phage terminase large subunit-like protein
MSPLVHDDDDDVYLNKITKRAVTKSYPTLKCRPAKGISKRVNIQIIKDTNSNKVNIPLVHEPPH